MWRREDEDEDEEESEERLECEIEMEKGRWKWRRVSGKIKMRNRRVGYKKRKKWLERGNFFGEKILDVWEGFGRLKKNWRERKYQKERENFEMVGV